MKKKIFKRGMGGLLAVLTAFTTLIGMGTTAFAASETAESYMVSYPRDGDAVQVYDQSTWGHSAKSYMNGWGTQAANVTTIHCMDSYDGKVCYCIEPDVPRNVGDSYSGLGENFWDNYPSKYNNTIEPAFMASSCAFVTPSFLLYSSTKALASSLLAVGISVL